MTLSMMFSTRMQAQDRLHTVEKGENIMAIKTLNTKLDNIERQLANLASRPYTQRAEEAKREAIVAQVAVQNVSDEVIENAGTFADFLEEYYLSQFE